MTRSLLILVLLATPAFGQARTATFEARDTLAVAPADDPATQAMLDDLAWTPESFRVVCTAREREVLVHFPSPRPRFEPGDPADVVVMEWYAARDAQSRPIAGPAVIVLHTIHPTDPIGRGVARMLASRGVHAFLLEMPGFGRRWNEADMHPSRFFDRLRQASSDARRARDAVAVLPHIAPGPIAIQGTSLGGIVAANAAALDDAFAPVLLLATGGQLQRIVEQGRFDAAIVRQRLAEEGISGLALAEACRSVEPLRLASRISPDRVWLYTARFDTVIPPACSAALANAIGLAADRRIELPGDHYTAIAWFPQAAADMAVRIHAHTPRGE